MVTYDHFKNNIYGYFDRLINQENVKKIIIIKIGASGNEQLKKSSPFLQENINKYNKVYEEYANTNSKVSVIDPINHLPENAFCEDGYHVNGKGNEIVYKKLLPELEDLL